MLIIRHIKQTFKSKHAFFRTNLVIFHFVHNLTDLYGYKSLKNLKYLKNPIEKIGKILYNKG